MKRIAAILLTVALLLGCLAVPVWAEETASGQCGADMTWSLEDGTLTIRGSGEMYDFNFIDSEIFSCESPWFEYAGSITTVTVESGVTSIGRCAFLGLTALKTVTLPGGITRLGEYSFEGCTALRNVYLPDTITEIGGYAFYGCRNLRAMRMPEDLRTIGDAAFYECQKLGNVSFAEEIASIGDYAFYGCTSLTVVDYEGSEEDWAEVEIGTGNDLLLAAQMLYDSMTFHHHSLVLTEAKDPTCTEDGNILFYTCSTCGNLYRNSTASGAITLEDTVIPALGHDWDEGVTLLEPGQASTGLVRYTCRRCGETRIDLIQPTGRITNRTIVTTVLPQDDGTYAVTFTYGRTGEAVESLPSPVTVHIPALEGDVVILEAADKEVLRKSMVEDGVAAFLLDAPATVRVIANAKPFLDVSASAWYRGAVDFASGHELFAGVSPARFGPDQIMTRAMLVTVLWRLEGSPEAADSPGFPDVDSGAYYAEAVSWGWATGVVAGYDDGSFRPDQPVTREQMAAFLFRYMNAIGESTSVRGNLDGFSDAEAVYSYARDAMRWCVGVGIIQGRSASELAPKDTATRAEVATMMMRLVKLIVKP